MNTTTLDLGCCQWRSQHIRAYVQVLFRSTDPLARELLALPDLHMVEEHSPTGAALWAAYNVAVGLPDVARNAIDIGLHKWSGDERLLRMREQLCGMVR